MLKLGEPSRSRSVVTMATLVAYEWEACHSRKEGRNIALLTSVIRCALEED